MHKLGLLPVTSRVVAPGLRAARAGDLPAAAPARRGRVPHVQTCTRALRLDSLHPGASLLPRSLNKLGLSVPSPGPYVLPPPRPGACQASAKSDPSQAPRCKMQTLGSSPPVLDYVSSGAPWSPRAGAVRTQLFLQLATARCLTQRADSLVLPRCTFAYPWRCEAGWRAPYVKPFVWPCGHALPSRTRGPLLARGPEVQ